MKRKKKSCYVKSLLSHQSHHTGDDTVNSSSTVLNTTLNTSLNHSNITLNVTTNATVNTIAAINNINIASNIFGSGGTPTPGGWAEGGGLFSRRCRPPEIEKLYTEAGATPLNHMREMGMKR